jgi:RNA methyltransferase, TrmH family
MKRITSRQNALVGRYRAVAQGAEPDLMLLDGLHLVADAAAAGLRVRHVLIAGDAVDRRDIRTLIARLETAGADIAAASAPVMAAASPVRSSSPIVAIAERPVHLDDRLFAGPAPLVLIACDVQDPGNVGAIARAGEAGGASGMIAAGECADPFGWKALRGSMGSSLRLPIAVRASADEAVTEARQRRCRIVAAVPRDGRSMFDTNLRGPVAIVVGGEGPGLARAVIDNADQHVTIPMQPPVESLNTAVTAALLVYEARRQRLETRGTPREKGEKGYDPFSGA